MRKSYSIALILALLIMAVLPAHTQKNTKKQEEFEQMQSLIEGGSYRFEVRSVSPTGGRTIHPSSVYTMTADQGTFSAHLPYFGRAYQSTYGSTDGGITFDGEPEEVDISLNERKRTLTVAFRIQGKGDRYDIRLVAGSTGFGTLSINCQNKQPTENNQYDNCFHMKILYHMNFS